MTDVYLRRTIAKNGAISIWEACLTHPDAPHRLRRDGDCIPHGRVDGLGIEIEDIPVAADYSAEAKEPAEPSGDLFD